MNLLLIEFQIDKLMILKKFLNDLEIQDYVIANNISNVWEVINRQQTDIIICNPFIFSNKERTLFSKFTSKRRIFLLWSVSKEQEFNLDLEYNGKFYY